MMLSTVLQVLCLAFGLQSGVQALSYAHQALEGRDAGSRIAKRSHQEVMEYPENTVVANAIPDMGVICWPQGWPGADEQDMLHNVIKLAHDEDEHASVLSPPGCTIKICHNQAAVIICNDNDYPVLTSNQSLGQLAWKIVHANNCKNNDEMVCGQQFSKGNWNVILRQVSQEACDSGILDHM